MSGLREAVDDYLAVRRSLGFKLQGYPWLLADFVTYMEAAGASRLTSELAVAWAGLPGADAHPSYLSKRLCVVRGFARHLQAFDPATAVPPADLLAWQSCRAVPYLYSDADIAALMGAARSLTPRLRAATYETLVGLLKVTGARVGELIGLNRDDVDWDEGVLVVRYSKFMKSRELPLHPTTMSALKVYADLRDEACTNLKTPSFFVSTRSSRLVYVTVQHTFSELTKAAGLEARSKRCRPRPHDARHTFACNTLLGWYRAGVDVEAHLPLLSTYLGHTNPSNTFWYLSAVPELLSLAAERREQTVRRQP
ncbi:MAG: tyrosine-type recombinase/integrase [Actinobacteria bacterium]|nr:tyrosine-type recombinase/integrase [Actinomycetota bacterium]